MTPPSRNPRRIQRKRTKGYRLPPGAIYVGRPSRWGNPFVPGVTLVNDLDVEPSGRTITRRGAVLGFRLYAVDRRRRELAWLAPLRGRDLACWCPLCPVHADGLPLGVECPDCPPCHGTVLLELANPPSRNPS